MQGYQNYSASMISQRLKDFGSRMPNTLNLNKPITVFYLSDEIYACGLPILVTIDPVSTAILKIELASNCQSDTWKAHFRSIEKNEIFSQGLASDRGVGIVKGYRQFQNNLIWCSDNFHEFRGLTKLLQTLESQAYEAVTREVERFQVFNNARTESNLQKQLEAFEEAKVDCENKMANYQHVEDVLALLFPALYFFDLKTGEHRQKSKVKAELLTLMDLLDQLELDKLQQETKAIRSHIDDICICYQQVEDIFQRLSQSIAKENLEMIGLAWQHDHQSHQYKGAHKKYHENERDGWLEIVTPLLGKNANALIERAFEEFNGMVRTSSLIEMVNSLIRPYINECKGQISQEHLNLIMFYHNYHQYKSGKRQGKAPIELLMKRKLEKDWLELLFETIAQTE
ncbi:MAG: hypothetical protein methR_P0617 [Methyloprofundus sp.]|nr:MAG: hypothetical protein methR_P0617 [Methyloprofundus sp.]